MDLNDFKPKSDTITVELKNPSNVKKPLLNPDGSPMTITVYGAHSGTFKAIREEITDRRVMEAYESGDEVKPMTSSEMQKVKREGFARSTCGWNITLGGECPEFSVEKALEVYTDFEWILGQVEAKAYDFEAFLGN